MYSKMAWQGNREQQMHVLKEMTPYTIDPIN